MDIETVLGDFRLTVKKCRAACKQTYTTYEEKLTDVNIAVRMLRDVRISHFDKLVLFSGDSDLVPPIQEIKRYWPHIHIHVVIPIGGRAEHLKAVADSHSKLKRRHLLSSLLPDPFITKDGVQYHCPPSWK